MPEGSQRLPRHPRIGRLVRSRSSLASPAERPLILLAPPRQDKLAQLAWLLASLPPQRAGRDRLFHHFGYSSAAFPQPLRGNHFGVLFLCGNIQHDTPRNSSFSPAARSPSAPFAKGPSPARSCRSLFPYLLYLLSFLFL